MRGAILCCDALDEEDLMTESKGTPPRMRVWIVVWSVATALLLGVIMSLSKMSWGVVLIVVLVPLALGVLALTTERRRVQTTHGQYRIETQAARSEASHVVEADPAVVRDAVRRVAVGRFRLVGERDEELTLLRRMNMASWGMTMRVMVTPVAEGTRIDVHEEPQLGTTIFDWGQGERDIVHLFDRVGEQLGELDSPAT